VLVCEGGYPGRAAIWDEAEPIYFQKALHRVRFHQPERNKWFLYYLYFKDLDGTLKEHFNGAGIQHFTGEALARFELPLPPLPEQQRIVGILDGAFGGIATAKANTEKNLQNARAIFDGHLQAVFSQRSDGWVNGTIGQHIRFIDYRGKTPEKTVTGLKLITAKNVKMGFLQETPAEFVAEDTYDSWMTRGIPRRGDVLFTTEAPLANVAQLDTDEKVVFAQRIIIMQADATKLDSTFLTYLLLSAPIQQRIHAKGTGATVKGIKASLLKTVEISFPESVHTQREIVRVLDALCAETQDLESVYHRKLAALDELKKSLLHRAFTGQL
jgi:type I restriction enzyme S subunit